MDFNEIKELIQLIDATNLSEIKIKSDNFSITVRSKAYTDALALQGTSLTQTLSIPPSVVAPPAVNTVQLPPPPPAPTSNVPATETAPPPPAADSNLITIKSPMVGTFYRSPGPNKDAFVKLGDTIRKGQVICIVEAMKLFNEIEAEHGGTIVKILADDG
ncbi:MAG TPA: acetyl-CoA carboxylase biotin carboxyl carrier protein, partial [Chitinophagales bacterium]|nr:acetyl-CoA carboxylase biotin carboxyl carrier protein [Chitinophagales bacterium]